MSFTEFLNNIYESSKERAKSPIIGGFFISWIIFNWKAVLILIFSNRRIEEKIRTAEGYFDILSVAIYPFFGAVLFILVVPWLTVALNRLGKNAKELREKDEHVYKLERIRRQSELTTEKEVLSKKRSALLTSENIESKLTELTNQNNSLSKEAISLRKQNSKLQEEVSNLRKKEENKSAGNTNSINGDRILAEQNSIDANFMNEISQRTDFGQIRNLINDAHEDGGLTENMVNNLNSYTKEFLLNTGLIGVNYDGFSLTKKGKGIKKYMGIVKNGWF